MSRSGQDERRVVNERLAHAIISMGKPERVYEALINIPFYNRLRQRIQKYGPYAVGSYFIGITAAYLLGGLTPEVPSNPSIPARNKAQEEANEIGLNRYTNSIIFMLAVAVATGAILLYKASDDFSRYRDIFDNEQLQEILRTTDYDEYRRKPGLDIDQLPQHLETCDNFADLINHALTRQGHKTQKESTSVRKPLYKILPNIFLAALQTRRQPGGGESRFDDVIFVERVPVAQAESLIESNNILPPPPPPPPPPAFITAPDPEGSVPSSPQEGYPFDSQTRSNRPGFNYHVNVISSGAASAFMNARNIGELNASFRRSSGRTWRRSSIATDEGSSSQTAQRSTTNLPSPPTPLSSSTTESDSLSDAGGERLIETHFPCLVRDMFYSLNKKLQSLLKHKKHQASIDQAISTFLHGVLNDDWFMCSGTDINSLTDQDRAKFFHLLLSPEENVRYEPSPFTPRIREQLRKAHRRAFRALSDWREASVFDHVGSKKQIQLIFILMQGNEDSQKDALSLLKCWGSDAKIRKFLTQYINTHPENDRESLRNHLSWWVKNGEEEALFQLAEEDAGLVSRLIEDLLHQGNDEHKNMAQKWFWKLRGEDLQNHILQKLKDNTLNSTSDELIEHGWVRLFRITDDRGVLLNEGVNLTWLKSRMRGIPVDTQLSLLKPVLTHDESVVRKAGHLVLAHLLHVQSNADLDYRAAVGRHFAESWKHYFSCDYFRPDYITELYRSIMDQYCLDRTSPNLYRIAARSLQKIAMQLLQTVIKQRNLGSKLKAQYIDHIVKTFGYDLVLAPIVRAVELTIRGSDHAYEHYDPIINAEDAKQLLADMTRIDMTRIIVENLNVESNFVFSMLRNNGLPEEAKSQLTGIVLGTIQTARMPDSTDRSTIVSAIIRAAYSTGGNIHDVWGRLGSTGSLELVKSLLDAAAGMNSNNDENLNHAISGINFLLSPESYVGWQDKNIRLLLSQVWLKLWGNNAVLFNVHKDGDDYKATLVALTNKVLDQVGLGVNRRNNSKDNSAAYFARELYQVFDRMGITNIYRNVLIFLLHNTAPTGQGALFNIDENAKTALKAIYVYAKYDAQKQAPTEALKAELREFINALGVQSRSGSKVLRDKLRLLGFRSTAKLVSEISKFVKPPEAKNIWRLCPLRRRAWPSGPQVTAAEDRNYYHSLSGDGVGEDEISAAFSDLSDDESSGGANYTYAAPRHHALPASPIRLLGNNAAVAAVAGPETTQSRSGGGSTSNEEDEDSFGLGNVFGQTP